MHGAVVRARAAAGAVALVLAGGPVLAHHAIASVYDNSRSVTIEGTVRLFRFTNPHPTIAVEVPTGDGASDTWQLELDNRRELAAVGMTPDTLRPGDRVVVWGSPARVAPRTLYVWRLDRPADGLRLTQEDRTPRLGRIE